MRFVGYEMMKPWEEGAQRKEPRGRIGLAPGMRDVMRLWEEGTQRKEQPGPDVRDEVMRSWKE